MRLQDWLHNTASRQAKLGYSGSGWSNEESSLPGIRDQIQIALVRDHYQNSRTDIALISVTKNNNENVRLIIKQKNKDFLALVHIVSLLTLARQLPRTILHPNSTAN